MIKNVNEAKAFVKLNSNDCKCNFSSKTCNSNQKWSNETCQCECKNYQKCKSGHSWNPSKFIRENAKYLKSFVDNSKNMCYEIIYAVRIVLKNV